MYEIKELMGKTKYTGSLARAFLGPSKKRTSQKMHQLNQYKTWGNVGLSGEAIK